MSAPTMCNLNLDGCTDLAEYVAIPDDPKFAPRYACALCRPQSDDPGLFELIEIVGPV